MPIRPRDPLHRVPGCWYVHDSRMLHNLDERTVEAMARQSAMASYRAGEFLQEAGEPMSSVSAIDSEPPVSAGVGRRDVMLQPIGGSATLD